MQGSWCKQGSIDTLGREKSLRSAVAYAPMMCVILQGWMMPLRNGSSSVKRRRGESLVGICR